MVTLARLDKSSILKKIGPERRRFQRIKVNLLGRFMLENQNEYPCHIIEMSPGDAALVSPIKGAIGEKIVLYIEELGRIEGEIKRHAEGGFALTINATPRKRDKLADQITWLANRHILNLPEDRKSTRYAIDNLRSQAILPDGEMLSCRVLDMSLSGAAIDIDRPLTPGTVIIIGNVRGRVVRSLDTGIAVEFVPNQIASSGLIHSVSPSN